MSEMFSATHWPTRPIWEACPYTSMPRTRPAWFPGTSRSRSPTPTRPLDGMPETTVPKPRTWKLRSIHSRNSPSSSWASAESTAWFSAVKKPSNPAPVMLEIGQTGASSRNVPRRNPLTSSTTIWRNSSSTRSILVSATSPWLTPISVRMSRCSRVWGMMPSSAAITKITTSIPCAPAAMLRMKSTWPGTSMMPRIRSSAIRHGAKPSSIVSPRCFSTARVSVSQPVRSFTRAVLPWSTCPAVPSMTLLPAELTGPPLRWRRRQSAVAHRSWCARPGRADRPRCG